MTDLEVRIEPNDGNPYLVIRHEGFHDSYLSLTWHVQPEELEQIAKDMKETQRMYGRREPVPF